MRQSQGSAAPAESFKQALCTNDVNYILLKRRKSDGSMPKMYSKELFCIFAALDKLMGGDCLRSEKEAFWVPTPESELKVTDETFEKIRASKASMPPECLGKWTVLVFSETFFCSEPLDDAEIEKVMGFCRLLTDKYKKLIISANFLHKYECESFTPSRNKPIKEGFIKEPQEKLKELLMQNRPSSLRFSNLSTVFWNGVPLSCYRKTSYCEEANEDFLQSGYGYDFGNWKSYAHPELASASSEHKKFAKLFNSGRNQIVASRTCSDMEHTPNLERSIKLLILTADGSPQFPDWAYNPDKINVCVSDADRGGFVILHGNAKLAKQIKIDKDVQNDLIFIVTQFYEGIDNDETNTEISDVGCC